MKKKDKQRVMQHVCKLLSNVSISDQFTMSSEGHRSIVQAYKLTRLLVKAEEK